MKKESPEDIFETQCWMSEIIVDPYKVTEELFSSSECFHLKGVIRKLIQCTTSSMVYSDKPPVDVILYLRMVSSIIRVAYLLKDKKRGEIVVDKQDLLNKKYYRSHYMFTDKWTDFPRFLAKKEYCNPYTVFRKFFNYKSLDNWINTWRDIVDGALNPDGGSYLEHELTVYIQLAKLIEAAHLVDVRENLAQKRTIFSPYKQLV